MARYCLLKGFLVKYLTDQIRHTLHDVQEFLFSGHLIIGNRRLHKMSCGIKLMPLSQIAEFLIRLFDDKVSIQISIRLLRLSDQIDHRIRAFFQLHLSNQAAGSFYFGSVKCRCNGICRTVYSKT